MPGSVAAKISAGLANKRTAGSALAGKQAPRQALADVTRLEREYFDRSPDPLDPKQLLSFGTSGQRTALEVLAGINAERSFGEMMR